MSPENPTKRVLANAALWEASRQGDIGGIRAALADGADGLDTALIQAAKHGQVAAIHYLIDQGANPDGKPSAPPLCWAAEEGHHKAVEALLWCGANPSLEGSMNDWDIPKTPLERAVRNDHGLTAAALFKGGSMPPFGRPLTVDPPLVAWARKKFRQWRLGRWFGRL